jgi:hypothetical protein
MDVTATMKAVLAAMWQDLWMTAAGIVAFAIVGTLLLLFRQPVHYRTIKHIAG